MASHLSIRTGSGVRASAAAAQTWQAVFSRSLHALAAWRDRARQRRHLSSLNDRMLRDIGVSRADIEGECAKPFWRL